MGTARATAAELPMVAIHRADRGSGPAWQARRGQELHSRIAGQASKHFNNICARNPPVRRHSKLRALSRWPPHSRCARLSAALPTRPRLVCYVVRFSRKWCSVSMSTVGQRRHVVRHTSAFLSRPRGGARVRSAQGQKRGDFERESFCFSTLLRDSLCGKLHR